MDDKVKSSAVKHEDTHKHSAAAFKAMAEKNKATKTKAGKSVVTSTGLKLPTTFGYTATQPATNLSDIVTVVKNISSNTLTFGFIPPHGKELAAGESVTINGDLSAQLQTGGGRSWKRKVDALQAAVDAKLIQVTRNVRSIVYCAVDSGTVIAAGDMVYLDTDDVKPASSFTWNSDIATTQAGFANSFLGIALSAHASGSAVTNFPVDMSPFSVYTYTADSEAHEIGDTLGPAKASGNALENQKLDKAVATSSIARCHRRDASAAATTVVTFQSAYWGGNAAGQQ